jgi:hypothetical protein
MQDFSQLADHNAGSWFGKERLDKPCPGDIRKIMPEFNTHPPEAKPEIDYLSFNGEPIQIK